MLGVNRSKYARQEKQTAVDMTLSDIQVSHSFPHPTNLPLYCRALIGP